MDVRQATAPPWGWLLRFEDASGGTSGDAGASFLPSGTKLEAWQGAEGLCMEARWTPMTRETAPVSFETPRPGVGTRLAERTPASCTPTAPSRGRPHGSAQSRRRHDDRGANCSLAAGGCERAVLLCGPGQGFRSGNGDPIGRRRAAPSAPRLLIFSHWIDVLGGLRCA